MKSDTPSSSNRARVLFVEDERDTRDVLTLTIKKAGYEPVACTNGAEFLALLSEEFEIILLDMMLPDTTGLKLLAEVKRRYPDQPVIMVSGQKEIEVAVEAMKQGAMDYVKKPFDLEHVIRLLRHALHQRRLLEENRVLRGSASTPRSGATSLIGNSSAMRQLDAQLEQLAQVDATVLLTGESGVGKSFIARSLHYRSQRAAGPFVAASCPSLPLDLVESELFGHEKGAFTGAMQQRIGRMELAHRGTLFLDEIGDLPLAVQPKLLTVLQERMFQRVGGSKDIHVDVRVIAATNFNLAELVRAKEFREDLYFRLNVVPLHIPPLRERREDIVPLCHHILARLAAKRGLPPFELDTEVESRLQLYPWPGNVRELENVLERATIFTPTPRLTVQDFPMEVMRPFATVTTTDAAPSLVGTPLAVLEAHALTQTLQHCQGNRAAAAKLLGISERSVYNLIARHQLK